LRRVEHDVGLSALADDQLVRAERDRVRTGPGNDGFSGDPVGDQVTADLGRPGYQLVSGDL